MRTENGIGIGNASQSAFGGGLIRSRCALPKLPKMALLRIHYPCSVTALWVLLGSVGGQRLLLVSFLSFSSFLIVFLVLFVKRHWPFCTTVWVIVWIWSNYRLSFGIKLA